MIQLFRLSLAAAAFCGSVALTQALVQTPPTTGSPAITETGRNTLVYDHLALRADRPAPHVLAVGNGDYFQVRFERTDPRLFDYIITAHTDAEPRTAGTGGPAEGIVANPKFTTAVTMRHNRAFQKYTVTISVKSGARGADVPGADPRGSTESVRVAPPGGGETGVAVLYGVSFDLWVRSDDWEVTFNGGFAFSGLTTPKFFVRTDTKGTAATTDDTRTVERDDSVRDRFRPDVIALTNVRHPFKAFGLGLAFGVGIGDNADPRYFFGPSYVFGRNFILTGGWTGGRVSALPPGQRTGEAPLSDAVLTTGIGTRFENSWFLGVGFSFVNRRDEFISALSASTKTTKPAETKPPEPAVANLVGTYEEGNLKAVVAAPNGVLTIAINNQPAVPLKHVSGTTYQVGDAANSTVTFAMTDGKATALSSKVGAITQTAKKVS